MSNNDSGAVASNAELGAWLPIATAPRDGTSIRVPPNAGYTHAFWQDGCWWWHSVHSGEDGDYAVGPEPSGWMLGPQATDFDASRPSLPVLGQDGARTT